MFQYVLHICCIFVEYFLHISCIFLAYCAYFLHIEYIYCIFSAYLLHIYCILHTRRRLLCDGRKRLGGLHIFGIFFHIYCFFLQKDVYKL